MKPARGVILDYSNPIVRDLAILFPFNEGSGNVIYDCKNRTEGVFTNSQVSWGGGNDGFAIDTPGDNESINVNNSGIRQDDTGWTIFIKFMMRTYNPNSQSVDSCIMQFLDDPLFGGQGKRIILINDQGGAADYTLRTTVTGDVVSTKSNSTIQLNTVYTIALRKNGTSFDWFFNGILDKSFTGTAVANYSEDFVLFDGQEQLGNRCFDGLSSLLYWWKRSLSDTEIAEVSSRPYCIYRHTQIPLLRTYIDTQGSTLVFN